MFQFELFKKSLKRRLLAHSSIFGPRHFREKLIRRGGRGQKVFFRTDPSDVMRQNDGSITEN